MFTDIIYVTPLFRFRFRLMLLFDALFTADMLHAYSARC